MAIVPPALDGFALASLARAMTGNRFHRPCEAAKPPKQSRWAGPRVVGGRRTVLPRPIPDCLAPALLGCAVTGRSHGNPP